MCSSFCVYLSVSVTQLYKLRLIHIYDAIYGIENWLEM